MFATFSEGAEATNDRAWDETPTYAPGRFHAHARPRVAAASPVTSGIHLRDELAGVPQTPVPTIQTTLSSSAPSTSQRNDEDRTFLEQPSEARPGSLLRFLDPFRTVINPVLMLLTGNEGSQLFDSDIGDTRDSSDFDDEVRNDPGRKGKRRLQRGPDRRRQNLARAKYPFGRRRKRPDLSFLEDADERTAFLPRLPYLSDDDGLSSGEDEPRTQNIHSVLHRAANTLRHSVSLSDQDGGFLRPSRKRVEKWVSNWTRRHFVLVIVPCIVVWIWCAVPFPRSDPFSDNPPWGIHWSRWPWTSPHLYQSVAYTPDPPTYAFDANFYFFLFFYYGLYLAVALLFMTKLFDLYRLNWWPASLGGSVSYFTFWSLSLLVGFLLHKFDLDGLHKLKGGDADEDDDWQRKTIWVLLAFATMAMPALVCFIKLRADRRNSYTAQHLTETQKTFMLPQLKSHMPTSYKRFLWFMFAISLSLFALIVGQAFATIYLSTLPHTSLDGLVYVFTWILTVQCLNLVSGWCLQHKIRSRALVLVFRYYYFLVYHVFYRNLFARLRSPDQALYIQLLSSSWVVIWYPFSMSKTFHGFLKWAFRFNRDWEDYAENVGTMFYLRHLSENVTMIAFIGWVTILHYGPNTQLYPLFSFETSSDPYTYRLTVLASLTIYVSEIMSSFLARRVIRVCYGLEITTLGLEAFKDHPEMIITCVWATIHVLMDILLFLIKFNFR